MIVEKIKLVMWMGFWGGDIVEKVWVSYSVVYLWLGGRGLIVWVKVVKEGLLGRCGLK